jgi:membrane protein DedA with SNARE-associated domain
MEVFEFLMPIFTEYGYLAVFVMLLICGFGVPVPEDVTLVTGGVIAGLGHADVLTAIAWPLRWRAPVLDAVTGFFHEIQASAKRS